MNPKLRGMRSVKIRWFIKGFHVSEEHFSLHYNIIIIFGQHHKNMCIHIYIYTSLYSILVLISAKNNDWYLGVYSRATTICFAHGWANPKSHPFENAIEHHLERAEWGIDVLNRYSPVNPLVDHSEIKVHNLQPQVSWIHRMIRVHYESSKIPLGSSKSGLWPLSIWLVSMGNWGYFTPVFVEIF